MKNSKIVITHDHDGKTTLARLYEDKRLIREAKARCSPEDTFDFRTGAELALDRLLSKYKPGDKVRIIGDSCCHLYMAGSIVTIREKNTFRYAPRTAWWVEEGASYVCECDIEPYVEPPKPKYWSGKVVCTENKIHDRDFKVGKIYEVVDGKIVDEFGAPRPYEDHDIRITCPEALTLSVGYFADWFYKFIPLVED